MRFVAGGLNGTYLREIHDQSLNETNEVKLAVAYAASSPQILQDCWNNKIKITFWGRYDDTGPISLPILKFFLDKKSPNFICKLVPDIFHPKVIWWKGYGAYIGSANLTNNGWFGNIEAGVFLSHGELVETGMEIELSNFFQEIDSHSHALTEEVYSELKALAKTNHSIEESARKDRQNFNKTRVIPKMAPITQIVATKAHEKRRNTFLKEWQETLQILRNIADRVSETTYRPSWVESNIPKGVQADQFLHAFYYSQVRVGTRSLHWVLHDKHKLNPEAALVDAMRWWGELPKPPHDEDRTVYEWAPFVRKHLETATLLQLPMDDFTELCSKIHALRDHSLRVKHTTFGSLKPLPKMNREERIRLLSRWLYDQRSSEGHSILETLHHVLWGGIPEEAPNRIFEAVSNEEWKIPHLGISTIGEMVGWAMPDLFPPRNGRTSKALTALGYDVNIHSE